MTEAEWLSATDTRPMLEFLGPTVDARKLRLFAVACCRRIAPHITHPSSTRAVELAELSADGGVPAWQLLDACRAADDHFSSTCVYGTSTGNQPARTAVAASAGTVGEMMHLHYLAFRHFGPDTHAANAGLLRDVFGNPFRATAFDPAWRTSTVLALARRMYETREFAAMPILADTLQDAGSSAAVVLEHCRSEGEHARGCWVVDVITRRMGEPGA